MHIILCSYFTVLIFYCSHSVPALYSYSSSIFLLNFTMQHYCEWVHMLSKQANVQHSLIFNWNCTTNICTHVIRGWLVCSLQYTNMYPYTYLYVYLIHLTNFCSPLYRLVVPYRQRCSRCRSRSTPTRSAHYATKDAPMRAITFAEGSMRVVRDSAVATLVAHWSMITNRWVLSRGASSPALWHRTRVSTARWPTISTGSKRVKSYWLRSRRVWSK